MTKSDKLLLIIGFILGFQNLAFNQVLCDTGAFLVTPQPPKIVNTNYNQISKLINNEIETKHFQSFQNSKKYLTFLINCKGEAFHYNFSNIGIMLDPLKLKEDSLLSYTILKILNDCIWKPGYCWNKPVDYSVTLQFIFKNNRVKIESTIK